MATFNTSPLSYEINELAELDKEEIRTDLGVAKVGGDMAQNFNANRLNIFDIDGSRVTILSGSIYNFKSVGVFKDLALNDPKTILAKPNGNLQAVSFTPFTGCHVIPNEGQNFKLGELIQIKAVENTDTKQPEWHGRYAHKYQQGIFGVVFQEIEELKPTPEVGANKFYSIACLGDCKVLCNNENGNIEYGDELCPSSIKGQAMRFTGRWDHRNQICGKAGRSHKFTSNEPILMDTTKE